MGGDTWKGSRGVIFYCYANILKQNTLKDTKMFLSHQKCKRQSYRKQIFFSDQEVFCYGRQINWNKTSIPGQPPKKTLTGLAQDFKYFLRKTLCPGICNRHYSYPLSTPKSGGWQTSDKFGICKKIKIFSKTCF